MLEALSALDPRDVAHICGVTVRAARGWRQRGHWPPTARRLLRLAMLGELEPIGGRSWRGWRLAGGYLVGPNGDEWDSGTLSAWWIERQQIPALQRDLRRARGGVPIIDRGELDRLQAAQQAATRAAHELARLFPQAADAGARGDQAPPPAPELAVNV